MSVENNVVTKPSHYTDGNIEVIDFIIDKHLGFSLGNAVKYIARAGKKYKDKLVEDLFKAAWYVNHRLYEIAFMHPEFIDEVCKGLNDEILALTTFRNKLTIRANVKNELVIPSIQHRHQKSVKPRLSFGRMILDRIFKSR